jgi:hypothetical protein
VEADSDGSWGRTTSGETFWWGGNAHRFANVPTREPETDSWVEVAVVPNGIPTDLGRDDQGRVWMYSSDTLAQILLGGAWKAIERGAAVREDGSSVLLDFGLGVLDPPAVVALAGGPWVEVATGIQFGCGIDSSGGAWCWGANDVGQLGDGTMDAHDSPAPTLVPDGWTDLAVGGNFVCGLRGPGSLWCWGYNAYGAVGIGSWDAAISAPTQIGSDADWIAVDAGSMHVCAMKADGKAFCWGRSSEGQLGKVADGLTPSEVPGGPWVSVQAGRLHTCAVHTEGSIWCWGENALGQVGNGDWAPGGGDGLSVLSPTRVCG